MSPKKDIKNYSFEELTKLTSDLGVARYRTAQIFSSLYREGRGSFDDMNTLPKDFREKLNRSFFVSAPKVSEHLRSVSGTEKVLFKLEDGRFVETVLIFAKTRKTLCLSTQVGCKFACAFCASGIRGYTRNLTPSEIVNQVIYFKHIAKLNITNYVFMGMGEPLDNFDNLATALSLMTDRRGMDVGARRITVSTSGIIPNIEKLKALGLQINLAVSLHAANSDLRSKLMPVNKKYPLEDLISACADFKGRSGRMITLEYVLIKDVNVSIGDADDLASIAGRLRAKVNLIPYSPVDGPKFETPEAEQINKFIKRLTREGTSVTLRDTKGKDIAAACGQLAGKRNEV